MRNYNNYADMITFSRASSGTALAKISYGPELVTNGTFDTDFSGWYVIGQQPTVVNSQLRLTTSSVNVGVNQDVGLQAGKMYLASYDIISITGGAMRLALGSAANGTNRTAPGSYSELLYVSGDAFARLYQVTSFSSEVIVVDNISVKEVLYDQPDGTLQLFNHPSNKPRVEYDYQGNRLGLLVEEARTNAVALSENFSTGYWTLYSLTVSQNSAIAPDGTLTASKITANGQNYFMRVNGLSPSNPGTSSIFVKKDNVNYVVLSTGGTTNYLAVFDLNSGSLIGGNGTTGSSIESVGNGWFRISISGTANPINGIGVTPWPSATIPANLDAHGDTSTTNSIYVWGAQMEAGTFPTSYIPTSGATATRAADLASIGVGAFGYNAQRGTIFVDFKLQENWVATANNRLFMLYKDFYNRMSFVAITGSDDFVLYSVTPSLTTTINPSVSTNSTGQSQKIIGAYANNNYGFTFNGNAVATNTSISVPDAATTLHIGGIDTSGYELNGHIKSITYYPRRLTDAQIQKLTQVKAVPTLSLTFDGNSDSYLETSIHG